MKVYKSKKTAVLMAVVGLLQPGSLSADELYFSEDDFFYESVDDEVEISDPFEGLNRYTFVFNDFLYRNVMDPIATTYTTITPDPVEKGASNFFRNLNYPVRLVGNLLQGRVRHAWVETGRFGINTTAGLFGILAPADTMEGFERIPPEEIGQALGSWGIGEGPYLVLPLLGPSNFRDLGGFVGDLAVSPFEQPYSQINHWNWEWRLAFQGSLFISSSPGIVERYNRMKDSAIDPYSALKNGYTQFRRAAIEE